jgi:thiamine kinase-like enzyme
MGKRIEKMIQSDGHKFFLAKTHGDLDVSNIIFDKRSQPNFVDWETMGERSLLFDILSMLVVETLNKGKYFEIMDLDLKQLSHVTDAVNDIERALEIEIPTEELWKYQFVYPLERIKMVLEDYKQLPLEELWKYEYFYSLKGLRDLKI